MRRQSTTLLIVIAFLSFVGIGLPGGVQGVAWPSIRASFELPLDAIAALFITHTIGYLLAGLNNGRLLAALGMGRFLLASVVVGGLGVLGYVLAPAWWVMVLCGLVAGLGAGAIDSGLNTYFAAHHGPSLMNWLHACFGLGAAIGPAIATLLLKTGYSWQWAYVSIVGFFLLLVAAYVLTWKRWHLNPSASPSAQADAVRVGSWDTLRLPVVWLSITLFFVFTGLEGSGGQWPYTLFTEARSVPPATAGLWVSVYWASLTAGRILFGIAARYIRTVHLLRAAMLGAIGGAVLIWWNPTDLTSFFGLALLGFSLAPIFPLSISETPKQLGSEHAAHAIGFQVAGASLGLAVLPGLAGFLAKNTTLETIGPFLVVLAISTLLLHESFIRRGQRRAHAR